MASTNDQPRKRLIIKLSYPKVTMDDDKKKIRKVNNVATKPIISCYWLDAKITLSQQKNNNKVVETDQKNKELFTPTTIKSEDSIKDVNVGCKNMIKKVDNEKRMLLKNDGETAEKKKKPMEHYKKMQCWVILKKMIEGRDGWALKDPFKILDESKTKPMCLKDIEGKLKKGYYSKPQEFAHDMRFVFSLGLLYHPRNEVHKIALRLSNIFEEKYKILKKEWSIEEKNIRKRKRESLK